MPETIKVEPLQLNPILKDVERGLLKIPRFQREVVWDLNDSVKLLDSIYRGLNAKHSEVTRFLETDLLPQVRQTLAAVDTGDRAQIQDELTTTWKTSSGPTRPGKCGASKTNSNASCSTCRMSKIV